MKTETAETCANCGKELMGTHQFTEILLNRQEGPNDGFFAAAHSQILATGTILGGVFGVASV